METPLNKQPKVKGRVRSYLYLERMLRAGKEPKDLGATYLAEGCQKAAYLWQGDACKYVIKSREESVGYDVGTKKPPSWIADYDARMCRQYRVGKWVIQEYATPLGEYDGNDTEIWDKYKKLYDYCYNTPNGKRRADLHTGNVGVVGQELVVFDW